MADTDRAAPTADILDRLDRLEADNRRLQASNDALVERSERLEAASGRRTAVADAPAPAAVESFPCDGDGEPVPIGRRQALRAGLLAAGATAAGAVLLDAKPAAAADGGAILMGTVNQCTIGTDLVCSASAQAPNQVGLKISDTSFQGGSPTIAALWLDATGPFASGLYVTSNTTKASQVHLFNASTGAVASETVIDHGTALKATSDDGTGVDATCNGNVAIRGTSSGGVAVQALTTSGKGLLINAGGSAGGDVFADQYQLRLTSFSGSRPPPTGDSTTNHLGGELVRDSNGDLWLCVAQGVPGTFRKLGGPTTAGQFHVLDTPARVYDSRPFTSPNVGSKAPLAANANRSVDLKANSSTVPADATAVMVNLLLVNLVSGTGNFTVWANGAAKPLANTMVFANSGASNRASTLAVTKVDAAALCQVNSSLKTDVIVDVVGYYR